MKILRRLMVRGSALALVLAATVWAAPAGATVPSLLNVQGHLTNDAGAPAQGTFDITFSLYASATAPEPVWSETVGGVQVAGGLIDVDLGQQTPLATAIFAGNAGLWLGLKVEAGPGVDAGGEPELPRRPLTTVAYAFHADHAASAATADAAGDLDCDGCVALSELGFDALTHQELQDALDALDVGVTLENLGCVAGQLPFFDGGWTCVATVPEAAHAQTADSALSAVTAGTAEDVVCDGCVGETDLDFDPATDGELSSAITGVEAAVVGGLAGECPPGQMVKGVNADGSLSCAAVTALLPPDGINEISNDLIFNQFIDVWSSDAAVPIPDNNPTGVEDPIVVPDVGLAQSLKINVTLTNSDLGTLEIRLFDPENTLYVLYNKAGAGTELNRTWPDPDATVSGDLTTWVGKNPQGTWRLEVIDTGYLDNDTDGEVSSWSIEVQTLSNKKIEISGNLQVTGELQVGGQPIGPHPAGMVAAFNRTDCPEGWLPADGQDGRPDMRGRLPIGTGPMPQDNSIELALGATGGAHRWRIRTYHNGSAECCNYSIGTNVGLEWEGEGAVNAGNGWSGYKHHLPPYLALLYCVKQ